MGPRVAVSKLWAVVSRNLASGLTMLDGGLGLVLGVSEALFLSDGATGRAVMKFAVASWALRVIH